MIENISIPKNFRKLEDIEGIKEAYRRVYSKISQQKFSGADNDNDEDDDESAEPQPKQTRKGKGPKAKLEKESVVKRNNQPAAEEEGGEGGGDDDNLSDAPQKRIKAND